MNETPSRAGADYRALPSDSRIYQRAHPYMRLTGRSGVSEVPLFGSVSPKPYREKEFSRESRHFKQTGGSGGGGSSPPNPVTPPSGGVTTQLPENSNYHNSHWESVLAPKLNEVTTVTLVENKVNHFQQEPKFGNWFTRSGY